MVERVVVGVNGSAGSSAAIAWLGTRASTVPMAIELFTVIEQQSVGPIVHETLIAPAYEKVLADAVEQLHRVAPDLPLTTSLRRGAPTLEISAASAKADLLVIGTREATGYFSGTLRHRVAAAARCPVIVVPSTWVPSGGPVVVGIEDDETSLAALEFAATEAERLHVELNVVFAWGLPVVLTAYWLAIRADPTAEIRHTHELFLTEAVTSIRARHPALTVRESLERGPAAVILSDIAETATLLVVGTHRRGMISGLLLGSVAHDLLVNIPCPIALVPHPDAIMVTALPDERPNGAHGSAAAETGADEHATQVNHRLNVEVLRSS